MRMQVRHFAPLPLLKGYIDKIWTFESDGPIPPADMKLIVPNGRIKLMIPFGDVKVDLDGKTYQTRANDITLIGLTDSPSVVQARSGDPSGTVGIEFNPYGAYRFFKLDYDAIRNRHYPLQDILGKAARALREQAINSGTVEQKVALLQHFLIGLYMPEAEDPIFDHCVKKLRQSIGKVSIKELERTTGYSSRWLNMKFLTKIGSSPKNLAAIIRFDECYRAMACDPFGVFAKNGFYEYYYDQSHFIRDFKRFTGLPPLTFTKLSNEFGKLYYRT